MKLRKLVSALLTLSLLGGAGWFVYDRYFAVEAPKIEYKTQPVERGRVTSTVTASGTLSPLKTVQVGSQVSGRIVELLADFNTQVKKGDVIARIDPSLLESDKSRSQANLQSAREPDEGGRRPRQREADLRAHQEAGAGRRGGPAGGRGDLDGLHLGEGQR